MSRLSWLDVRQRFSDATAQSKRTISTSELLCCRRLRSLICSRWPPAAQENTRYWTRKISTWHQRVRRQDVARSPRRHRPQSLRALHQAPTAPTRICTIERFRPSSTGTKAFPRSLLERISGPTMSTQSFKRTCKQRWPCSITFQSSRRRAIPRFPPRERPHARTPHDSSLSLVGHEYSRSHFPLVVFFLTEYAQVSISTCTAPEYERT